MLPQFSHFKQALDQQFAKKLSFEFSFMSNLLPQADADGDKRAIIQIENQVDGSCRGLVRTAKRPPSLWDGECDFALFGAGSCFFARAVYAICGIFN